MTTYSGRAGIDEGGVSRPAGGVSSINLGAAGFTPIIDIKNVAPVALPGGDRELWQIDGKLYLVWQVPVDADGDGEYDDSVPISFLTYPEELRKAGLSNMAPTQTLSGAQWDAVGGLEMGSILDLRSTDQDPFKYFVDEMVRQSEAFPWLIDPEIMAVTAGAWLMGRDINEGDLARTEWWRTHSANQRNWLLLATTDPASADRQLASNRIQVLDMLEAAGVNNAPTDLINLMADSYTRGEWDSVYLGNQVQVLADPSKRGRLDTSVQMYLTSGQVSLDTTQSRRDKVIETVNRWLGPAYGSWTDEQIERWAGKLRNDPDAEQTLETALAAQRMALFPTYTDPSLTYQDIASPWREVVTQAWGSVPDETDPFFTKIVATNDLLAAQQLLRSEGLVRKNKQVATDALRDLYSSVGGQVARMQ